VRQLQRQLTSRDFTELAAYYSLYPYWPKRLEDYLAQIAQEIQHFKASWTGEQPGALEDFKFDYTGEKEEQIQSEREMERVAQRLALLYG
jgi:hypothetical protein